MTFTDDDLSLMKIQMYEPDQTLRFHWPEEKLKALLARLEAAEKAICIGSPCERCKPLIEAWRKAAGK